MSPMCMDCEFLTTLYFVNFGNQSLTNYLFPSGPIVSSLANKYGCRTVCIVGGFIASIAYFLTIFANSVEYLMVFQGVIGGRKNISYMNVNIWNRYKILFLIFKSNENGCVFFFWI